jgi:hypothetical protein
MRLPYDKKNDIAYHEHVNLYDKLRPEPADDGRRKRKMAQIKTQI